MPNKFISYSKMSKKEKKKINNSKRTFWTMNPASKDAGDKRKEMSKACCRGKYRGDY